MKLVAHAPGKIVLLGEYAVLADAPALAVAVDRRVSATLSDGHPNDGLIVDAPDVGITAARALIDEGGQLQWQSADDVPERLRLVSQVWDAFVAARGVRMGGLRLAIDTGGFFGRSAVGRAKLGLGSSAALTVALAAVLKTMGDPDVPDGLARTTNLDVDDLIGLHRGWQQGQGSGIDIAASLTGGLIGYRQPHGTARARIQQLAWPPAGTCCAFIWSGEAVSTARALQRLAQWRADDPAAYRARMAELCTLAQTLPQVLAGSARDFIALVADYAAALARLAQASGLTILTDGQAELARLAQREGMGYKPCGAGGDIGVAVADDPARLHRLRPHLDRLNLQVLPLAMAAQGLQVDRAPNSVLTRSHVGH